MDHAQPPNVAIVSANPLNSDIANGIMMRSLFRAWPEDRLAQICFPIVAGRHPQFDVCQRYHLIETSGRVRRYHGRSDGGTRPSHAPGPGTAHGRMLARLKANSAILPWLKLVQELWYSQSWMERALEQELRRIRPDVVYALLGHFCLTRITVRACARLRIPYFLHVTDDFITAAYQSLPFARHIQRASQFWFQRAVDQAACRAAVSPLMADAFHRRYGDCWEWFTTLVNADDYDPNYPTREQSGVRLVYTGELGLGRWQVLQDLGATLDRLCELNEWPLELHVYAPDAQIRRWGSQLAASRSVVLKGWVNMEQLPGIFGDADILVHVESDESQHAQYTRYSLSTKISQYMMAGRCILGIGPDHVGSMQAIRNARAGLVIPNRRASIDEEALTRLLTDRQARAEFGNSGRRWAVAHVSSTVRQSHFRELLRVAAASASAPRSAGSRAESSPLPRVA